MPAGVVSREVQIDYANEAAPPGRPTRSSRTATVKYRDRGWCRAFGRTDAAPRPSEGGDGAKPREGATTTGVRVVVAPGGSIGHWDTVPVPGRDRPVSRIFSHRGRVYRDRLRVQLALGDRSIDLKYKQFDFELTHHKRSHWAAASGVAHGRCCWRRARAADGRAGASEPGSLADARPRTS